MKTSDLPQQELSPFNGSVARITLASPFIIGVIKQQTVNLVKLALVFETAVEAESNYRRLQGFLDIFRWIFACLAGLMAQWLLKEPWGLCLDRSPWQIGQTPVKVFMLAVAYKGIAIPLLWPVMANKGNSNKDERIVLRERVLQIFGWQAIAYLTADREFRGREWLAYLKRSHIPFRLRIPNNTQVSNRHRHQRFAVTRLFPLKVGEVMVLKRARTIWELQFT